MKLYHYAKRNNTVLTDGLFCLLKGNKNLVKTYGVRANSDNEKDVIQWLESTFSGRTKSVSCLTEKIKWQNNHYKLKTVVDELELFSFELDDLLKDGIIEAIYCKNGSEALGKNELFYQVSYDEIDTSELAWEKCDLEKGIFFAVIRHYLLVLKDGVIPAKYITKEI